MSIARPMVVLMRRAVLRAVGRGSLAVAGIILAACPSLDAFGDAPDEDGELVKRVTGKTPTLSSRVHLEMPPVFSNGYTVPMTVDVESPMTETDHVRLVHVLAPRNPLTVVAIFQFTPQSGRARVSTRVRLAEPQNVLAAAEMSDGTLLMAKTWVKVATNGCA